MSVSLSFKFVPSYSKLLFLLAALAASSQPGAVAAQDDESGLRAVRRVPTRTFENLQFDSSDSAGIFIGVSQFDDSPGFAEVPFAVDDAIDLAHLFSIRLGLIEPEKVVLALAGRPRKASSKSNLGELLIKGAPDPVSAENPDLYSLVIQQADATGPDGIFVVMVATHGIFYEGEDYLLASNTVERFLTNTSINAQDLFDGISRSAARRRLVFTDACRRRLRAPDPAVRTFNPQGSNGTMTSTFSRTILGSEGQAVLQAARVGGYAYDDFDGMNGVFTSAILTGLKGAAQTDDRGYITVRTLADFVDVKVKKWVLENRSDREEIGNAGITWQLDDEVADMPLAWNVQKDDTSRVASTLLSGLTCSIGEHAVGALFMRSAHEVMDSDGAHRPGLQPEGQILEVYSRAKDAFAYYLSSRPGPALNPYIDRETHYQLEVRCKQDQSRRARWSLGAIERNREGALDYAETSDVGLVFTDVVFPIIDGDNWHLFLNGESLAWRHAPILAVALVPPTERERLAHERRLLVVTADDLRVLSAPRDTPALWKTLQVIPLPRRGQEKASVTWAYRVAFVALEREILGLKENRDGSFEEIKPRLSDLVRLGESRQSAFAFSPTSKHGMTLIHPLACRPGEPVNVVAARIHLDVEEPGHEHLLDLVGSFTLAPEDLRARSCAAQLFPRMVNEEEVFDIHAIYNCGESQWCYQVFERSLDQTSGELPVKVDTDVKRFDGRIQPASGLQEGDTIYVVYDQDDGQRHVKKIDSSRL